MTYTGGCLCGAVRYESTAAPRDAGYCHCRMCQISSGAPVLPWASFALESFAYVKGRPKIYRSSREGQREFCADCGSQLAFRPVGEGETVEINTGTLDDPATVRPGHHIWYESRVAWFEIDDDLPRYAQGASGGEP